MKIGKWLLPGLLLLPLAELLVFVAVAAVIGLGGATVLLIAGSGVGVLVLHRHGPSWLQEVRDLITGRTVARDPDRPVPAIPALAAVLLAVPGFLTDAAAALLLVPAVRQRLDALLGTGSPRGAPGPGFARRHPGRGPIVDLAPDEWQDVPDPPPRRRRRRPPAEHTPAGRPPGG